MARIFLDYHAIQSSCLNQLDNSINQLSHSISNLQRHSIPNDFDKRTILYRTIEDLKRQQSILSDVSNWLIRSNRNYDSLIDKLNSQASKLPVYTVKTRSKII